MWNIDRSLILSLIKLIYNAPGHSWINELKMWEQIETFRLSEQLFNQGQTWELGWQMQFWWLCGREDSIVMKPGHVRRIKVEDLSSNKGSLCAGCHVFFFPSIVTIRRSQVNLIFIDCLPFPSLSIGFLCSSRSLCMQTKHQMRCLLHPQFCFIAYPHLGHILVVDVVVGIWCKSNRETWWVSVGSLRMATLLEHV